MTRSTGRSRTSTFAGLALAATMAVSGGGAVAHGAPLTDVPTTLKLTYKAGAFKAKVGSVQSLCSGTVAGLERTVELRRVKGKKLVKTRKTNARGIAKFKLSRRAVRGKAFYTKVRPLVAADYGTTFNCLARRSNRVKR